MPHLVRCPICQQKFDADGALCMPFCSERCRQIDLRRWLGEQYGLQIEREDAGEDAPIED
ncbi:MAG: DNA gyrase inhibitor YacG [Pirellulales bacterium]|nr:DNA gyrase inhibitor YacG [Pirellulales bacterium]